MFKTGKYLYVVKHFLYCSPQFIDFLRQLRDSLPDEDCSDKECGHLTEAGKDHSSNGFRVSPPQVLHWD